MSTNIITCLLQAKRLLLQGLFQLLSCKIIYKTCGLVLFRCINTIHTRLFTISLDIGACYKGNKLCPKWRQYFWHADFVCWLPCGSVFWSIDAWLREGHIPQVELFLSRASWVSRQRGRPPVWGSSLQSDLAAASADCTPQASAGSNVNRAMGVFKSAATGLPFIFWVLLRDSGVVLNKNYSNSFHSANDNR